MKEKKLLDFYNWLQQVHDDCFADEEPEMAVILSCVIDRFKEDFGKEL